MADPHHATVHCEECDRDIEAYNCVEIDEMIQWLKDHDNCPVIHAGRAFTLTLKDWQYLLNWGRK